MELAPRMRGTGANLVFEWAEAHTQASPVVGNLRRHQAAHVHLNAQAAVAHAQGCAQAPTARPHTAARAPLPSLPPRQHVQPPQQPPAQQLRGSAAARLNAQLGGVEQPSCALREAVVGSHDGASAGAAPAIGLGSRLGGLVLHVGEKMQPQGEAPGDATWHERTINVLTSLPFLGIGWTMHRQRLTPEGRHHARSMMAVGVAATVYHASSGRVRRWARKLDYYTIAYTSSTMLKCLYPDSPGVRRAANLSLLAVPFKPFAVSTAHTLVMQTEFARTATHSPAVRSDLKRHYTAAALGMAAFFSEDLVMDTGFGGLLHAAWHCLACYGCHTMNGLLANKERQTLQRALRRQSPGGDSAAKPLRRTVHSSASSLPSYGGGKLGGWSPGLASP